MNENRRWLLALLLSLTLALSMGYVTGCDGEDEDVGVDVEDERDTDEIEEGEDEEPADGDAEDGDQAFDASQEILATTADHLSGSPAPTIAAEDLYNMVTAGDTTIQLVDIRAPEHFEVGHVEGSINVPFRQIAMQEQLDRLDMDRRVIVVCYTGHTASMATIYFNQLGYDAVALKYGISGWTTDEEVYGLEPFPTGEAGDYPTEEETVEAESQYDLPDISVDADNVEDAIIERTQAYFDSEPSFTIAAEDVYNNVVAPGASGYQILSVRSPDHYVIGHLPGAINVAWTSIASEENLTKLDPDSTIIVYCYTGHTGAQVSMFLSQMGYDAVNMRSGMASWTSDEEIRAIPTYNPEEVPDYPTVPGADEEMPSS